MGCGRQDNLVLLSYIYENCQRGEREKKGRKVKGLFKVGMGNLLEDRTVESLSSRPLLPFRAGGAKVKGYGGMERGLRKKGSLGLSFLKRLLFCPVLVAVAACLFPVTFLCGLESRGYIAPRFRTPLFGLG